MSKSSIFVGMDVHQDSVTLAVFEGASKEPTVVQRLPNDLRKLRWVFDRWAKRGEIRGCYEASGAGYVLQRELLRSRHYILKFLRRRGFVFQQGARWGPKHRAWLERLLHQERLAPEDRAVFGEYLALYGLQSRSSRRTGSPNRRGRFLARLPGPGPEALLLPRYRHSVGHDPDL